MINNNDDFYYMNEALKEAYKAYRADEVPVGCVIVNNGKIIATSNDLETVFEVVLPLCKN